MTGLIRQALLLLPTNIGTVSDSGLVRPRVKVADRLLSDNRRNSEPSLSGFIRLDTRVLGLAHHV